MKKTILLFALMITASITSSAIQTTAITTTTATGVISSSQCTFVGSTQGTLVTDPNNPFTVITAEPTVIRISFAGPVTIKTTVPVVISAPPGAESPSSVTALGKTASRNFTQNSDGSSQLSFSQGNTETISIYNIIKYSKTVLNGKYVVDTGLTCE